MNGLISQNNFPDSFFMQQNTTHESDIKRGEDEESAAEAIRSMSLLLAAGADINLADAYEQTPLIYSVRQNTPSVIIGFLLNSGTALNATDAGGFSALCYALADEQTETVIMLRKLGATEPSEHALQNCRWHTAIRKGDVLLALAALAKGADANARNHAENPPLPEATYLHGDTLPQLCIDEVQYAPELLRAIKLMGDEAPPACNG